MKPFSKGGRLVLVSALAVLSITLIATLVPLLQEGPGTQEIIAREVSPGGERVATVVRVSRGGATVGFSYRIEIHDISQPQERNWIWRSYKVPPARLVWKDEATLVVQVSTDDETEELKSFVRERRRKGVVAKTTFLPAN